MTDNSFNLSPDDADYNVWLLLRSATDAVAKARGKELEKLEISRVQSGVLFLIQTLGEEATPSKISRWMLRTRHSVSELINRMKKDGLLIKVKDLRKKNQVRVMLTEKGQQIYEETKKRESITRIMSALTDDERQQLKSYLETIWVKATAEVEVQSKKASPSKLGVR